MTLSEPSKPTRKPTKTHDGALAHHSRSILQLNTCSNGSLQFILFNTAQYMIQISLQT